MAAKDKVLKISGSTFMEATRPFCVLPLFSGCGCEPPECYTFTGSISAIFILAAFARGVNTLKGKNLLIKELTFFLMISYMKANRKSQKLCSFVQWKERERERERESESEREEEEEEKKKKLKLYYTYSS